MNVSRYTRDQRDRIVHVDALLSEYADNTYSGLGTLVRSRHSTEDVADETFKADAFGNIRVKTNSGDAYRGNGTYRYQAGTGRLVSRAQTGGEADSTAYDLEGNQVWQSKDYWTVALGASQHLTHNVAYYYDAEGRLRLVDRQTTADANPHITTRTVHPKAMSGRTTRFNIQLDERHALKLHQLAERTHVNPGTLARSLLSTALDETAPDPSSIGSCWTRFPAPRSGCPSPPVDPRWGSGVPWESTDFTPGKSCPLKNSNARP